MEVTRTKGRSVEIKDLTGEITIGDLKKKLSAQFSFDERNIILKSKNEEIMKDEKFLKDYIDVKTFEIVVKNKTKIRIEIKYDGRIRSINAFKEMTGEELQKEVNKKFQMKKCELHYEGKVIKLMDALNDHNIFEGCVILLVTDVEGGDKGISKSNERFI